MDGEADGRDEANSRLSSFYAKASKNIKALERIKQRMLLLYCTSTLNPMLMLRHTEWLTKCHTIDCTHNTFLLLPNYLISGTELILIGWKIVPNESLKFSVCKEPTLYQSVHENVSESLLYSWFLHKTIQFSPFDLQSTARCPPFYNLVTSIAFSMNYSIHSHVCNVDTVMLQF